ncbi:MAG TPA: hypothetical protein DHW02_07490 [Ktedonobacter sp.]|nr:hypothetical protein [Ktedonobacter sp.]
MPDSNEKLASLLKDMRDLSVYMHGRGDKTRTLSQQFAENAKRDPANREFDLNQSRMLDYQHSLWHEVGNLVDKLIKQYDS